MKKITLTKIDYIEWEDLVRTRYGVQDYSFVSNEEVRNDSEHLYEDIKKEPLDKYDEGRLKRFNKGEDVQYMTLTLIQDMVNNDVLLEGSYLIEVCW